MQYTTNHMDIIIGVGLLLLILGGFSLFTFFAPRGVKAMGAMADAAVATYLVEALLVSLFGNIMNVPFLADLGALSGSLSGVAAAGLVALALGVSPVYAIMIALPLLEFGILPGFIAGYLTSFVVLQLEERVPAGFDMLSVVFIGAPLSYGIGLLMTPPVDAALSQIGGIIDAASTQSPIIMGFILGGLLTVVSTAPISSMALTAMMGLTGHPMAIAAMAIFSSAPLNYTTFKRLGIGNQGESISVAIEALTQADLISSNPLIIYSSNFIFGGLSGIVVALSGLVNNSPGTASVTSGLIATLAWNPIGKTLIVGVLVTIIGLLGGIITSLVFKNFNVVTSVDLAKKSSKENAKKTGAAVQTF